MAGVDTPSEFMATTEKAIVRATGSESSVQLMAPLRPDVTVHDRPAADTAYEVIGDPPSLSDGVKLTVAETFPLVGVDHWTPTFCGALGAVDGGID